MMTLYNRRRANDQMVILGHQIVTSGCWEGYKTEMPTESPLVLHSFSTAKQLIWNQSLPSASLDKLPQ